MAGRRQAGDTKRHDPAAKHHYGRRSGRVVARRDEGRVVARPVREDLQAQHVPVVRTGGHALSRAGPARTAPPERGAPGGHPGLRRPPAKEGPFREHGRNKLDPIRVIFRRALKRDEIPIDPTDGLELPAVRGRRERIADRTEAAELIVALPSSEQAFWATAVYGGLRRGELRALRWTDVELDAVPGLIHVRRTWDDVEGEVEVKTDAGLAGRSGDGRTAAAPGRSRATTSRSGSDLVFGRTAADPFIPVDGSEAARCVRGAGRRSPNPESTGRRRSGSRRDRTRSIRSLPTKAGTLPPAT